MSGTAALPNLRNLGPKSSSWLAAVGVETIGDLEAVGPVEAYRRCRDGGFPVSLNLLWALAGALYDLPWNQLPAAMKEELRRAVEG